MGRLLGGWQLKLDTRELKSIREYLLGRSPQEERPEIEQRILTDTDYFQEVLIGEEELTDEYVANQLSESDRHAFETNFLVTVDRQKRVRFARRWKNYIDEATGATVDDEVVTSPAERSAGSVESPAKKRSHFSFFPALNPVLSYSLAAAVLLAIVGVSWLNLRDQSTSQTGGNVVLTLTPGLTRDAGTLQKIKASPGLETIELRLVLQKSDYRVYRSVLLGDDRSEVWASGDLTAVNDEGASVLVSRVPAKLLVPGDYRVAVSGRSVDSAFEDIATYSFRVTR